MFELGSVAYGSPFAYPGFDPSMIPAGAYAVDPYYPGMPQAGGLPFRANVPLLQGVSPMMQGPFDFSAFLPATISPLANAVAVGPLSQMLAQRGYLPGGMRPGSNLFDQARDYQFQEDQRAVQQAV